MTLEGPNISRTFIEGLGRNKSKDACKIVVLGTRPSLVGTYVWRQFDLTSRKLKNPFRKGVSDRHSISILKHKLSEFT